MSVFGPILSAHVVENAIADTIKAWIGTYLPAVAEMNGLDYNLAPFRSYNIRPDNDKWVEDQLPALIVISAGTSDQPVVSGDGSATAPMRFGVGLVCSGPGKNIVNQNTKVYAAAVRAILSQKRSLGGLSDGFVWEAEEFEEPITKKGRSAGAAVITVVYHIHDMVNKQYGPAAPNTPPDEQEVIATEADLTITRIPV